jgi:hypothetical protein
VERDDYHKAEVQRRKESEQRSARVWLLDDKLYDLYNNDPLVHAALRNYIDGRETLEKCLINLISTLVEARKKDLEHAMMKQFNPTIKIGVDHL